MPTYLPPRRGISHSAAVAEARVYARVDDPELLTLALYHSTIVDQFGAPSAVYVVCDYAPLVATLEADAPVHPGQTVTFQALPMEVVMPEETEDSRDPRASIQLDYVARILAPLLDSAVGTQEPVRMIARTYLASDTSAPHEMPPLSLEVQGAETDGATVRFQAGYGDVTNFPFPAVVYSAETGFAALAASQR